MNSVASARAAAALAVQLRHGTQAAHRLAERSFFIRAFLKGLLTKDAYRHLLIALYQIYGALERQLAVHREHPAVQPLFLPELWREQELAHDLTFFAGPDWQKGLPCSPATVAYIARLDELGQTAPRLLAAHAYTRYLGDLSGGQILQKMTRRAFRLTELEGVRFYHFAQIPDLQKFKDLFRARLDALPLSSAEQLQVVAEANHAFTLNRRLFTELEGSWVRGLLTLL